MHSKCKKLQLDPVPPKMFNKTIQNKMGNIRYESKRKTKLVAKSQLNPILTKIFNKKIQNKMRNSKREIEFS